MNFDIIDKKIETVLPEVISLRREFHENPELSYEEERTARRVAEELEKLGIQVQRGVGGHGVVGLLEGAKPGKVILLRADMDALPIHEKTGLPFASKVPGVMHACGHDVHTSTLLGVAKVLSEMREELRGSVKFCFQPAEEANPKGGAQGMIDDGILENPKVDAAVALHVWSGLKVGEVKARVGIMMAQSNRFYITVRGKASHGSAPQEGVDAIFVAADLLMNLQQVVSRNVNPLDSVVVSVGTISGGDRYNVLCDEVKMEGTCRIFSDELTDLVPERMQSICDGIAKATGAEIQLDYVPGYKLTENDPELTELLMEGFREALGDEQVIVADRPAAGGEDFSAFKFHIPSFYFWLGMDSDKNKGKTILHNPTLTVDEDAIPTGIKALVSAVFKYLST